jgi:hypothetical protein
MIGGIICGKDGNPSFEHYKSITSVSKYQPPRLVKELWAKIQTDYNLAFMLQHRPFREFDGYSLLTRSRMDQETFAAYVGCEYVPQHKKWRWKGRKNIARNKLIAILARVIAGMLYPSVNARTEGNEDDKMAARVMRMRIEDHLRKAKYEVKFLFMALSALVNPAVFVQVEWIERIQKIKVQNDDGTATIEEFVNELMSGVHLHTLPIDEIMLCDYYSGTGDLSVLPVILRVRRIPWDDARAKWQGKHFSSTDKNEKGNPRDLFDYVEAGKTRIVLTGTEHQELFDIEWSEADKNYVQELTAYYPYEDLEVCVVGGVAMVNEKDPYNTNPFTHRRFSLINGEWKTVPVLPFAASGFEPLDPTGRFFYYKSGAFKEYWDDAGLNKMYQIAYDSTYLDTFPPVFLAGVGKVDSLVHVPGGAFGMPPGATATPFRMNPNIKAVFDMIGKMEGNLEESTKSSPIPTDSQPGVTATQTNQAVAQARLFMGIFGILIADLIKKVGELVIDCEINYAILGEIDEKIPGHLEFKDKTSVIRGKEKGRNITNNIVFTSKHMGKKYTPKQIQDKEWALYDKNGKTPKERAQSNQRTYEVNPYQYARTVYEVYADADQIIDRSTGATEQRKLMAFNIMTDPRVAPFTDRQNVVDDFVIEEFGGDDPEKYKAKQKPNDEMLNSIMGGQKPGKPNQPSGQPVATPQPAMV